MGFSLPRKLKDNFLTRGASRVIDQVNPLDNNRSWKQRTPTNTRSVAGQLTHNAITNTVGNVIAKPAANTVSGLIVEPARSVTATITGNQAARKRAEERKFEAIDKSIPGFVVNTAKNVGNIPVTLAKQTAADFSGDPIRKKKASDEVMQNLNKTPFGALFSPVQHNLAGNQVKRDMPYLSKEDQQAAKESSLASVGLDPKASLGKQMLESGLAAAEIAGTIKAPDIYQNPAGFITDPLDSVKSMTRVAKPKVIAKQPPAPKIETPEVKPKVVLKTPEQIKAAQKETLESLKQEARKYNVNNETLRSSDPVYGKDGKAWLDYNARYDSGRSLDSAISKSDFEAQARGDVKAFNGTRDDLMYKDVLMGNKKVASPDNAAYNGLYKKLAQIDGLKYKEVDGHVYVGKSLSDINKVISNQVTPKEYYDLIGYKPNLYNQPPKSPLTIEKKPTLQDALEGKSTEFGAPKPIASVKTPETIKTRTTDEAIREIAGLGGLNIGQSKVDLGVTNKLISAATGGNFTNVRGVNVARTLADKAGEKINKATEANITGSGAPVANKARAVFAGTGLADETKQIARVRHGQYANIKDVMTRLNDKDVAIQNKYGAKAQEMLDRVMRDESYTSRVYGSAPSKLDSLPEDLQALVKEKMSMNKVVNDLNYETGVIDAGTWKQGTEGQHIGRIFAIPKAEKSFMRESINSMFEAQAGISRKDITKMSDELIGLLERDPIRAINLRMELALRNKAITEAMDAMAARKFIQPTPPNKNFVQMNGRRYGAYNGQWIERGMLEELTGNRIFNSGMVDSLDRFVNGYKGSLLGVSDRLQKAFKTTLSPGTIVGNISSNPIMFNPGAGTNPLTQTFDMLSAARKLSKGVSDADVYAARQLGVIGGDTGKLLTGSSSETLAMGKNSGNIVRRGLEKTMSKFGQFYGSIDDAAKLGLWTRLQKQGLSPQKAALEVAKFTQDYNNVGRVVTLIADTPVLGKPFARFSPELVRIVKNNATRAPHRMIAGVAALAYIANKLSKDSGESEEERKAREGQVGQTRIPGTSWINELMGGPSEDVSLNLPFGDSAVNVARAVGLNFPMEPGVDPNRALLEQLLPVEIPTSKNSLGEDVFDPTKVVTSMTLKPLIEQVFDKNFMGNPVSDPTNRSYDSQGQEKKFTELPQSEQTKNRLRSAAVSLLPLGNEADSLISAATGNENVLGKERTLPQAIARTFGIKAENNDKQAREDRVGTAEYFEVEKKKEQDFLRNNKDLEQLYFDIFPKTKDRATGRKVSDQITPEKWARINAESSGRMFEFMKQTALDKNKSTDGKYPVDPIFQLPTKQQEKIVSELRSRPTGEDIESEEILRATQSWYPEFEKAERDYYDKSGAYYDSLGLPDTQNERAKAYAEIPFAEQPKLVKDYYALKATDPEAAKAMFKTTNLSDEFDEYTQDRLRNINEKRKIEGYPPIDATTFNNVTFGYEDDESAVFNTLKYGRGYGSGRGGSSGSSGGFGGIGFKKASVPGAKGLEKVSLKGNAPEIRTKKSVKRRPRPKIQLRKSMV